MKYLHKGGYVSTYTREEMEKRDRDEGRIRMPAVCITAIIGLGGAVCLWDQNVEAMEPMLKKLGLYGKARCARGLMVWILDKICRKLSYRQNCTIQENVKDMVISCGAKVAPRCVNISQDKMDVMVETILQEKCSLCMATAAEAKHCKLRETLDAVPGVVSDESGVWSCPYMQGKRQEWEVQPMAYFETPAAGRIRTSWWDRLKSWTRGGTSDPARNRIRPGMPWGNWAHGWEPAAMPERHGR